jgi:hypothetical protein
VNGMDSRFVFIVHNSHFLVVDDDTGVVMFSATSKADAGAFCRNHQVTITRIITRS